MDNKILVWLMVLTLWLPLTAFADLNVVYPYMEERPTDSYGYKVLALALEKSGRKYHLSISKEAMNAQRARKSIDEGTVSILDAGTSPEFERRFAAVYFPIDRGLSGYRIFIINKDLAPEFAAIKTLADLQKKVAGQGPGWADVKILENAGIRVELAEFAALFRMVDKRRFDFFPLGVEEMYTLFDRYKENCPDSMIETTLSLHYPFARLFFVKKDNKELHDAITEGLQKAFDDGSFQALLNNDAAFKDELTRANLKSRTIIEVTNPTMTPQFKKIPEKYFARPLAN